MYRVNSTLLKHHAWLDKIHVVNPESNTHRILCNITILKCLLLLKPMSVIQSIPIFFEMIKLSQFYRNVFSALSGCKIQKQVGSSTRG